MGAPDKTRIKRLLGLVSEKCAAIVCPNADYEAAVWEVFTGGFAIVPVAMDRVEAMAAANLAIYADVCAFDKSDMYKLAGFITPACAKWNLENRIAAAPKVGDVDPAVVATVQAESDKVAAGEDWAVVDPGNIAMPYTREVAEPRDDRHGNHAMLAKMDPKEPFFILRGQDVFASGLVKQWADLAESGGVRRDKIENARQCARAMRQWPVKKLPD